MRVRNIHFSVIKVMLRILFSLESFYRLILSSCDHSMLWLLFFYSWINSSWFEVWEMV